MVLHLIFPHSVLINRINAATTVDSKYGTPTTAVSATLVYNGRCRVSQDHEMLAREVQGDDLSVFTLVYLPPGLHDVEIDDEVQLNAGEWIGRIAAISDFTTEYYTRLLVKRDD